MARREFTQPVRTEIVKRATRMIDGNPMNTAQFCEECGALAKKFEVDHIKPDGLEIDKSKKLTAKEGALLCLPCHDAKTPQDVADIAQAKRREAAYLGAKRPKQPIKSAGFPKKERREQLPIPPRRGFYA